MLAVVFTVKLKLLEVEVAESPLPEYVAVREWVPPVKAAVVKVATPVLSTV
jgi:hypothetical protein